PRAVVATPSAAFGVPPGVLSTLDPATQAVRQNVSAGLVGSDPFLRHLGDRLYIVNRGEGNITILDASSLFYLDQLATGGGTSPQDVAVVGDKLYVPALGSSGVVVLQHGEEPKSIDLSAMVGDPDGKPDCVSAYAVGDKVYVACGLLDGTFTPRAVGQVAVI